MCGILLPVVVWCRNKMNYNPIGFWHVTIGLWFDVEIRWITTDRSIKGHPGMLWFDVEIRWITTIWGACFASDSCGLM